MADESSKREQFFASAKEMHDQLEKALDELGAVPLVRQYVAAFLSAFLMLEEPVIAQLLSICITSIFPAAKGVLKTISDVRRLEQPEFNELTVEVLNEILGTEMTADDVPVGKGSSGAAERSVSVGKKLYDVLTQMFTPAGVVTPESGERAAQAFTGFTMNWSMSSAFLAILGGVVPVGHFDELKELGEELARNIGLERLQRRTLGVLLDNAVQKPYDAALRRRYRPDRLTDAQYVKALHAGAFDETYVRDQLAQKGFPDAEIDRLMIELTAHLAEADILRLIRYGDITQDEGVAELNVQGIPKVTAERLIRATTLSRADSIVNSFVNKIESQYINGLITEEEFNKELDTVPWTDEEKKWERNFVGQTLDVPQQQLTFSQVKTGIVSGILDFDYLDRWLIRQGYSDEDQLYLEYEILQAMDKVASKDQIASQKAARVNSAPKVAPKITRS